LEKKIRLSVLEKASETRDAIVRAALAEFVQNGFAGTRMDDIATRAGVAKGTLYLHFTDKEALFGAIVKQEIQPSIDISSYLLSEGSSLENFIETKLPAMVEEILEPRRRSVLLLLIGEAGRFPSLAKIYYRLVIAPGSQAIRVLAQQARERGVLHDATLVEFPQLLIAPLVMGLIWTDRFAEFELLDVRRMMQEHGRRLLGRSEFSVVDGKA
jgi:AcrR family transcriptional regulator